MYFDGINVGIYNMRGIVDMNSELLVCLATDGLVSNTTTSFTGALDQFSIYDYKLSTQQVKQKYQQYVPAAKFPKLNTEPVAN